MLYYLWLDSHFFMQIINETFFCICEQTSAGAVMLTDVVFWLIIFPFLTAKDYTLSLVSTKIL